MVESSNGFKTFDALVSDTTLVTALGKENITVPTEVQQKVIPLARENKDLIVRYETGTGKTLAYLLPIFEKINAEAKEMQVIILTPTHELAVQIERQIERLSQNSGIKAGSAVIVGNVNIDRQVEKLREKPHMIVGTPGRILELIKKRKIAAHTIKTIVLDEADRLLDEGNIENVKAVIKTTLKERQIMLFSATMPPKTINEAREFMKEPELLEGGENLSVPESIEHLYFFAEQRDKIEVLRKLVRILNPSKAIVFVNKSDQIEIMTAKLKYHGLVAEAIHGAHAKQDRKSVMEQFKAGKLQLLVASDIAARGLQIDGVTHVFNLAMPEDPRDYLHRAGRTGRIGEPGTAVSIITGREIKLVKLYENTLGIKMLAKDMYMGRIIDLQNNKMHNKPQSR